MLQKVLRMSRRIGSLEIGRTRHELMPVGQDLPRDKR